jgi:hypothetical protein
MSLFGFSLSRTASASEDCVVSLTNSFSDDLDPVLERHPVGRRAGHQRPQQPGRGRCSGVDQRFADS